MIVSLTEYGTPDHWISPTLNISSSESEYEDGDPNEINPNQSESTEKNSSGNNFQNKQKNLNFGNYENSDKSDEKTDELSRIRITRD